MDTVLLAVLHETELWKAGIYFNLVYGRNDARVRKQNLEVLDGEIRHADGLAFTCIYARKYCTEKAYECSCTYQHQGALPSPAMSPRM